MDSSSDILLNIYLTLNSIYSEFKIYIFYNSSCFYVFYIDIIELLLIFSCKLIIRAFRRSPTKLLFYINVNLLKYFKIIQF